MQCHHSGLGQRLLGFKEHVAWFLLGNHELEWHTITDFGQVLSLQSHQLVSSVDIIDL